MKHIVFPVVLLAATLITACGSGAPPAPIGFDRRPANAPEAIAALTASGDRTPVVNADPPSQSGIATSVPVIASHIGPTPSPPIVISDFSEPDGLASLSDVDRAELIKAAQTAQSITIRCRGDRTNRSQAHWNQMARRGARVKVFLVENGVDPQRVRLLVQSTGGFVADSRTAVGRAKNRRVEVHFG